MIKNHIKILSEEGNNKEVNKEKMDNTENLFFEKFDIVFNIHLKLITDDSFNVSLTN